MAERAAEHDSRVVTLGPLVFFSAESGDAWMLDPEDGLATLAIPTEERLAFPSPRSHDRLRLRWMRSTFLEGRPVDLGRGCVRMATLQPLLAGRTGFQASTPIVFREQTPMASMHFNREESSRRGDELYHRIRPELEANHRGEVVAIDLLTGEYEVAADTLDAARRLRARCPEAEAWFIRVGHEALYRIGPRSVVGPVC